MTGMGRTSASAGAAATALVDGKEIQGTLVPLARAGSTVRVEVVIGPEHRP